MNKLRDFGMRAFDRKVLSDRCGPLAETRRAWTTDHGRMMAVTNYETGRISSGARPKALPIIWAASPACSHKNTSAGGTATSARMNGDGIPRYIPTAFPAAVAIMQSNARRLPGAIARRRSRRRKPVSALTRYCATKLTIASTALTPIDTAVRPCRDVRKMMPTSKINLPLIM